MNQSIARLIDHYIRYLRQAGYCDRVIGCNRRQLGQFDAWAQTCQVRQIDEVTFDLIDRYREQLTSAAADASGRRLNRMIQRESWTKLRRFLSWLHRKSLIDTDLSANLSRSARRLRRA